MSKLECRPLVAITLTVGATVVGCADDGQSSSDEIVEYAALVRGTLAADDLEEARALHDQIAMAGEAAAIEAGDFAHAVYLGTTMLDSVENEFLAVDRWRDREAMEAFYAGEDTARAFADLFAGSPTVTLLARAPEWVSWGDMDSGEASEPHYVHLAVGSLASADRGEAQRAHDQVASGGKDPSIAAGNVAHVVYLGLDDPGAFVAADIWASDENLEAFYSDPNFRAAFEPLFSSVSEPVFQSTDWYQW